MLSKTNLKEHNYLVVLKGLGFFSTFLKTDRLTLTPSFMKGLKSINPNGIYPQTDTEVLFWTKAQYFLRVNPRHK